MSTPIDDFLTGSQDFMTLIKELGGAMQKEEAAEAAQALLAHAIQVVLTAKAIAVPHKLPLSFFGTELRYPEDCDAGYQLADDFRIKYPQWSHNHTGLEPKFLGHEIWNSSENCSDQGLSIFEDYDDFALTRDDRK